MPVQHELDRRPGSIAVPETTQNRLHPPPAREPVGVSPRREIRVPEAVAIAAGGAAAVTGVAIMVAWHLHLTSILEVRPGYTAMQYNTALALALTGVGIVALTVGGRRWAGLIIGGVDLTLGLLTLAQYATGRSFGIDTLLFHPYIATGSPGRMAPNTALCVTVLGAAILGRSLSRRWPPAALATAGSFVMALGLVALFGYASNLDTAYGWGNLTAMALNTALAMTVTGFGLVALAWADSREDSSLVPEWIAVPLGVLALGSTMLLWLAFIESETNQQVPVSRVVVGATVVGIVMASIVGLMTWLAQRARRERRAAERLAGELEEEVVRRTVAEDEARRGERRLFAFLEELPVGVFIVDSGGEPYYINRLGERVLGTSVVPGISAEDLPSAYQAYVAGTDQLYPPEGMSTVRALHGETGHVDDMEVARPEGRVSVETWGVPVRGEDGTVEYAITVFAEVTERRRAQQATADQAALLDLAHDAIFVHDTERRIKYWNRGAERTYGFSRDEAEGRIVEELLQTRFPAPRRDIETAVGDCDHWEGELVHRTGDGRSIVVETRMAAHRELAGRMQGTLEICRDVTARKEAEAEVHRRAADLDEANRALQQSNRDLEQFAYAASHDLSEPLRAISGPVSLLARRYSGQLDAEADQFIEFAVDGCARMQSIIEALLAYSRVGRLETEHGPVDTGAVVEAARRALGVAIAESGATITVGALPSVTGERAQLGQLFQNVLSNAIKFRTPGLAPVVHVGARREDGGWRFSVTDNGIGIEAHQRERVFGMFKRLHSREEYPGTGIGLALCERIIERHGGRIGIENGPHGGTCIWFTLPADPQTEKKESTP